MRKNGLCLLLGCLFLIASTAASPAGRIADRRASQQKRIQQGIKSGSLTKGEVRKLEQQQYDIRCAEKRARTDGKITPAERVRLEAMQDKADKAIYGAKHNDVRRPGTP